MSIPVSRFRKFCDIISLNNLTNSFWIYLRSSFFPVGSEVFKYIPSFLKILVMRSRSPPPPVCVVSTLCSSAELHGLISWGGFSLGCFFHVNFCLVPFPCLNALTKISLHVSDFLLQLTYSFVHLGGFIYSPSSLMCICDFYSEFFLRHLSTFGFH